MRYVALALSAAAALLPGSVWGAAGEPSRPASTVEVTAESYVEIPADLALLDFGVMTQAPTAAAAARQNSERMDAVLAAVRKALGAKAQLSTGTYSLRADYAQPPIPRDGGAPKVVGYTASNVVQLKTAELARLGDVIDLAIKAGANQVQRIAFTLNDPASPHREALRDAALKARAEAEAIAAALDLKVTGIHSVIEQDTGGVRPLMRESAMMARVESAPATPVEPGLIQVRARIVLTVNVTR